MKISSPKDAVLAITYRCNSRCRMCNIWQKDDFTGEITPDIYQNLPKSLRDINLSGGEPFLRDDITLIVQTIKQRCKSAKLVISTNGFATDLITSKMREILPIVPEVGVAVSLDGVGEAHDQVRGVPGGIDLALATLRELKKIGVRRLKIGFTLGDYNTEELPKVYDLSRELGAEFSLAIVHSSANYFSKENEMKDKGKVMAALDWLVSRELESWQPKRLARAYFAHGAREFIRTGERLLPDYSGRDNVFIDPAGDIYPNDVGEEMIGNLKQMNDLTLAVKAPDVPSWMICTTRQAMRKHPFSVGWWILKNKALI